MPTASNERLSPATEDDSIGRRARPERPERPEREPESLGQRIEDNLIEAAEDFAAGEDLLPDPDGWQARFDALEESGPRELPESVLDRLEEAGITYEVVIGDDSVSRTFTGPDGQSKSKTISLSEDGMTLIRTVETTNAEGESWDRTVSLTLEDDVVTTITAGTARDGTEFGFTAVKDYNETGYDYSLAGTGPGGRELDVIAAVNLVDQIVTLTTDEGELVLPFDEVSEYIDGLMEDVPSPIPPVDDSLLIA